MPYSPTPARTVRRHLSVPVWSERVAVLVSADRRVASGRDVPTVFDRWRTRLPNVSLEDIAAGIEVTHEQHDNGVATAEEGDLRGVLADYESDLPCHPDRAVTVVEAFVAGASVGAAGRDAGVVPVVAAKTLHRLGFEGVSPLGPAGREVVRDWTEGRVGHAEARELADAGEREFVLAAFVETHDPIDGANERVRAALADATDAAVEKRDRLGETMGGAGDPRSR